MTMKFKKKRPDLLKGNNLNVESSVHRGISVLPNLPYLKDLSIIVGTKSADAGH